VLELFWMYWTCYNVLCQLEDTRAATFLKRAYRKLILAEANLNPQQLASWYRVPAHRKIHQAMRE
ncbi:MAG: hypothetical protein AAF412_11965, partial [Pseudomonadota bacterium]